MGNDSVSPWNRSRRYTEQPKCYLKVASSSDSRNVAFFSCFIDASFEDLDKQALEWRSKLWAQSVLVRSGPNQIDLFSIVKAETLDGVSSRLFVLIVPFSSPFRAASGTLFAKCVLGSSFDVPTH